MKFEKNEVLDCWVSNVLLRGHSIELQIDASFPIDQREQIALESLAKVSDAWPEVQQNILKSLHNTYNDSWADEDEGFPILNEDEFIQRIIPTSLHVGDGAEIGTCLGICFSDSGIFLGHFVEIFWEPEKMYKARLAG